MSPLTREGIRLCWITAADPIIDAVAARITSTADIIAVIGSVLVGRDPRQVVLNRYKGRMR